MEDARFAQLVSLACHDLRTPLATVHGFARTLARTDLADPAPRYVEMIEAASAQIDELVDELSLVARIEAGRFEPRIEDVDSLVLVREAAADLEDGSVRISGEGAPVRVEVDATRRALRQLARATRRHGGLESVDVAVRGAELELSPLAGSAAAVVTGTELRELGAAAAVALLRALGGSVDAEADRLRIALPAGG
jgi:signal transduction histidine kinase